MRPDCSRIRAWNGASWSSLSAPLERVRSIQRVDLDGAGPAAPATLVAAFFSFPAGNASLAVLEPCCRADLNHDGQADFADYLEFLNRYEAADLSVDFTGDGLVDFADYLEFLSLYDAGC